MAVPRRIDVLGAGPAGLGVGYYARQRDIPFTIWEAAGRIGGNAVTFVHGDFRFDSGAHRFHDRDPEITRDVKQLLGPELKHVESPSQIHHRGRSFDFPLSPLNLLRNLGPLGVARASVDLLRARAGAKRAPESFQDFALHTYGETIARAFLLDYSEKLWGLPCDQLSMSISGSRLRGLDLRTFVTEALLGKRAKTAHLDGTFYYPRGGYGEIVKALARSCGDDTIELRAPVTRLLHDDRRLLAVGVAEQPPFEVDQVVSTLPLGRTLQMLAPKAPEELLALAKRLRYRSVLLVALFIDKPRVTDSATVYFPDARVPFTRLYEPRNRHPEMAPPGKTSLVAEIPSKLDDAIWAEPEDRLVERVTSELVRLGWIRERDVIGHAVERIMNAYPVLERGFESLLEPVFQWLSRFRNLRLSGRSGRFAYSHVHDQLRAAKDIVSELCRA